MFSSIINLFIIQHFVIRPKYSLENARIELMKRCLVIPGPFVPHNDTITKLVYKQLRLLDMEYDVCALENDIDNSLLKRLTQDPCYAKFHTHFVDQYHHVLFSPRNINLLKGLCHMKRYVNTAASMYTDQEYIYTNSWPCYTIRAARKIQLKHPHVKWIASFSDPINHSPYKYDQQTYASYSLPEKIAFKLYCRYYVVDADEANAFEHADLLVFICPEQRDFMIRQYVRFFGKISKEEILKKCVIVALNYIPEWNTLTPCPLPSAHKTFVLAHFGRVYGLRLGAEFIYALRRFCDTYPNIPLSVDQYGEFRKKDRKLIHTLQLDHVFHLHERVPFAACMEKMKAANAVLLLDTILPDDEIQPYLPSKILEYSLLRKDVLTITTRTSPSYRICQKSGALVCSYDRNDIFRGLEKIILQKQSSKINYALTNAEAIQDLKTKINALASG